MSDGLGWMARTELSGSGYCVTIGRGVEPVDLAREVGDGTAVAVGEYTAAGLEEFLAHRELQEGGEAVAVRYGQAPGGLAFAVAHGACWPGQIGPGYTDALSESGAEVFQLYFEAQNPKLPPPDFICFRGEECLCGFTMDAEGVGDIGGQDADLVRAVQDRVGAAGITRLEDRDVVHERCLDVVAEVFGLSLSRDLLVDGCLPAMIVKGGDRGTGGGGGIPGFSSDI